MSSSYTDKWPDYFVAWAKEEITQAKKDLRQEPTPVQALKARLEARISYLTVAIVRIGGVNA